MEVRYYLSPLVLPNLRFYLIQTYGLVLKKYTISDVNQHGKKYIDRLFDKELEFYIKTVGAVQIVGPKYCGRSRTSKRHAKTIIDLMKKKDRDQYVELAKNAPEASLN